MKRHTQIRLQRTLRMLMALCAAGILFFAGVLRLDSREYAEGDAAYEQIRRLRSPSAEAAARPGTPSAPPSEAKPDEAPGGIDWEPLAAINPDVVGWIAAEGTEIDYPVVQGDNNDFYLDHLFTGERNKLGSIFMDCRNDAGFADKNTILYGHNMKDGSMFSSLTKYKDQRYYDRHPAMLLHTPEGSYRIELFAGIVVDGDDESVRMTFRDDDDFLDYVGSLRQASTFVSDTAVGADDRIVTLCTCSYEFNNARFALFGKLTPLA